MEKTILTKLKSTSTTVGTPESIHTTLNALAKHTAPGLLREAIKTQLEVQMSTSRKHDANVFDPASIGHLNQTLNYLAAKFMTGLAFVKNTGDCAGDIGIVYGVSYKTAAVPKTKTPEEAAAELFLPLGSPTTAVYFHVQVALPNGTNTSWRINNIEPMDDDVGFLEYKSFYWDPVVAKKSSEQSGARQVGQTSLELADA